MVTVLEKEFRSLFLRMINDLKENSNKQLNEERNILGKKFNNMDKKIRKEIETLKYKLRNIGNEN